MSTTTISIENIHCPSCTAHITALLSDLPIENLSISIFLGSISFATVGQEEREDVVQEVKRLLVEAGFDLGGGTDERDASLDWIRLGQQERWWDSFAWLDSTPRRSQSTKAEEQRNELLAQIHRETCTACQDSDPPQNVLESVKIGETQEYETTILINGMTCSSCVSGVKSSLASHPSILRHAVTLLPGRAVVCHTEGLGREELVELIEEGGYEAVLGETRELGGGWVESRLLIEGMTCS